MSKLSVFRPTNACGSRSWATATTACRACPSPGRATQSTLSGWGSPWSRPSGSCETFVTVSCSYHSIVGIENLFNQRKLFFHAGKWRSASCSSSWTCGLGWTREGDKIFFIQINYFSLRPKYFFVSVCCAGWWVTGSGSTTCGAPTRSSPTWWSRPECRGGCLRHNRPIAGNLFVFSAHHSYVLSTHYTYTSSSLPIHNFLIIWL